MSLINPVPPPSPPRFENLEGAPYAYNAGGVKEVQNRAKANTDPSVLAATGGGGVFPLYYMDLAENGNYIETNEIAKRHGVCGDPRLVSVARGLVGVWFELACFGW